MKVITQPGDIFLSSGSGPLPWAIRIFEKFWSKDGKAVYNHGGVILDNRYMIGLSEQLRKWSSGKEVRPTAEASLRIRYYDLDDRVGCRVLIARHKDMNHLRFVSGMKRVEKYIGRLYPVMRLPLFAAGIAQHFKWGPGVCTEFTGHFMAGAGFKNIIYGISPDDLHDRFRIDKDVDIIFEEILDRRML